MSHRPPYSSVHTHADVILEIIILDLPGISKENSETYRWADAHCLSFLPFFLSSLPLAPVTKTYKMVIIIKFNDFNQRISASLNWGHPIHHSFALFGFCLVEKFESPFIWLCVYVFLCIQRYCSNKRDTLINCMPRCTAQYIPVNVRSLNHFPSLFWSLRMARYKE